jgi:hypothetical protein
MSTSKKIGAGELKVGGRYLHHNGLFVRQIEAIEGDTVFWHDKISGGQCSKKIFLRQCHSVAPESSEDISPTEIAPEPSTVREFSMRDEANALTAFAFRHGFLEDLHAGKPLPETHRSGFSRISNDEMRQLMIEASEKLARLLKMQQEDPARYKMFIRDYHSIYCRSWKRD